MACILYQALKRVPDFTVLLCCLDMKYERNKADLLCRNIFFSCPISALICSLVKPATECLLFFLLRLTTRVQPSRLQLGRVPCWKLRLCFILQSSEGSPGSFWSDEHNSCTELGLLTARPDQMSQVLRSPAASPHSRVTRMSRGRLSCDFDPCQGWIPDGYFPSVGLQACFTQH